MTEQHEDMQNIFYNAVWYKALALEERLALLRNSTEISEEHIAHTEYADTLFQRWKQHPAFLQEEDFCERLRLADIQEGELYYLLSEPAESIKERVASSPDWLLTLKRAFTDVALYPDFELPMIEQEASALSFLSPLKPLIRYGMERVQQRIDALLHASASVPFQREGMMSVLYANLAPILLAKINRVLVLEMHIARLQGQLQGGTPEERFQCFILQLNQPERMLSLLTNYPVIARQLVIAVEHWSAYCLEFLQHLCTDWRAICTTFFADHDPGPLLEVKCGVGDLHREGRSVMLLRFQGDLRLVYKPKSLAIDVHFQDLLRWLNEKGASLPFRVLTVLDRGRYGWSEFVSVQGCDTLEEVQHFYGRQGGYLALLYVLDAVDFHFENLLAAGEQPVLIDLEALFHPHFAQGDPGIQSQLGSRALEESVLRSALLPTRLWSTGDEVGVDISGLGGRSGQIFPRPVSLWKDIGTDQMQLIQKRVTLPGRQNRPTLSGEETNVVDYQEQLISGFIAIYQLLMQHRQEFIAGPLTSFAHDEIRCITRATHVYHKLLEASFHPKMLRDALERERVFEYLWMSSAAQPDLLRIIPAERQDLHRGDIPFFTSRPGSHHLYSSRGDCIPDIFSEPGQEVVIKRIQHLSEQDLQKQLWLIQASLAAVPIEHAQRKERLSLLPARQPASKDRLLQVACQIGDRLCEQALYDEQEVTWIGLTLRGDGDWSIQPASTVDLYSGIPGIILFLAYLGSCVAEQRYTCLAQSALRMVRRQVRQMQKQRMVAGIGAFQGWGSIIYLYAHLGALWNESTLLAEAGRIAELLVKELEDDEAFDLMRGAAGAIMSLAALSRVAPDPRLVEIACQCGHHLVAQARVDEDGVGWTSPFAKLYPLTGLSHGAAGIALSLLTLANLTNEAHFRHVACAAMEYERHLFSPQERNWPDLRALNSPDKAASLGATEEPGYMVAWCHGAAGIGMARLASLSSIDDEDIRQEIEHALHTTLAQGFGHNHSLCHGDLGNLETLLTASQVLGDPYYEARLADLTATLLENIECHGWRTSAPQELETPGLMTGISGIGYELLRLAEPERVPAILLLAPPTVV